MSVWLLWPWDFIQALSPTKKQDKNTHDFSIIPSHYEENEGFQGAFDIRVRAYSLSSLSSSCLIDIGQSHVIFFMFSSLFIWRFPKIGVITPYHPSHGWPWLSIDTRMVLGIVHFQKHPCVPLGSKYLNIRRDPPWPPAYVDQVITILNGFV